MISNAQAVVLTWSQEACLSASKSGKVSLTQVSMTAGFLRVDDEALLLTREQERALSALPCEYATDAARIKRRTRLSKEQVEAALQSLVGSGLADAVGECNGAALFRTTVNGVEHRQIGRTCRSPSRRIWPSTPFGSA